MNRQILLRVVMVCLPAVRLVAQGYDTKFKEVGFKPGDVYHSDESVNVSLTGGSVEVALPLGPALPGPISLRPMLHVHNKYTQGLNPGWNYQAQFNECLYGGGTYQVDCDAYAKWSRRWSPPSFPSAVMGPGKLLLAYGAFGGNGSSAPIKIDAPGGMNLTYWLDQPGTKLYTTANGGSSVVNGLVSDVAPEWVATSTGNTDGYPALTNIVGIRLSDGSTLVFGPNNTTIYNQYCADHSQDSKTRIPDEILQIGTQEITLWRRSRNVMQTAWDRKDTSGTLYNYFWNGTLYHPAWIKTRSGFKVTYNVFRDPAAGTATILTGPGLPDASGNPAQTGLLRGWEAYYLDDTGAKVGYKVDAADTANDVRTYTVTFTGMANTPTTTGISGNGRTPVRALKASGPDDPLWQPGTTEGWYGYTGDHYDLDYESGELQVGVSSLQHGALVTSFEWGGAYGLLSKLTTPSGKSYTFQYQIVKGVGARPPEGTGQMAGWQYNTLTPLSMDFWSVVTQMDVADAVSSAVRSTKYQWALPQPNGINPPYPGAIEWSTTAQGVAQSLPDGQTILHVFAPPVNMSSYTSPSSDLDYLGRTFLATRQTTVARYYYEKGDSTWQSFFSGSSPAGTNWYKRELFEGWDLRAWASTLSKVGANAEPRATREIVEERNGPVYVKEEDLWLPEANRYGVKRSYSLAPAADALGQFWAPGMFAGSGSNTYVSSPGLDEASLASATSHTVTRTTYAPESAGLYDRVLSTQVDVRKAPPSGATGRLPKEQFTYDSQPDRAHLVTLKSQVAADDAAHLDLNFTYQPQGLFTKDRLVEVSLSGAAPNQADQSSNLSGAVGAKYNYDGSGRWRTKIQLRKDAGPSYFPYALEEPSHDGMGRALSQKDANGFVTSFTWDGLGRLLSISPQAPESGTGLTHDDNLRKVTLDRGAQHSVYQYNSFGDLIAESRTKETGKVSTRTYGYDKGGRKTWETVWDAGAPTLGDWSMNSTLVAHTQYTYDSRGRVTSKISPLQHEVSGLGTVYETLTTEYGSDPLVTTQLVAQGTNREARTVFTRDVFGRLASVVTSPDGAKQYVTNYHYDAAGRIDRVEQKSPDVSAIQYRYWEYDTLGRLKALVQPESGRTEYDQFTVTGKPTVTRYGVGPDVKAVTTYYDAQSRPINTTSSDGSVTQSFRYDESGHGYANGQLSSSSDGTTSLSRSYTVLNGRLSSLVTSTGGQVFTQTFDYDSAGRRNLSTIQGRTVNIEYSDATGLANQARFTGNDGQVKTLANLLYDEVSWAPTSISFINGAHTTFDYFRDQTRLKLMAHHLTSSGSPLAQYSYDYDVDGTLKSSGFEDSFQYDLLGRLIQASIAVPATTSGRIVQNVTYDAFGNRLSSNATPTGTSLPPNLLGAVAFSPTADELTSHNQLPAQTVTGVQTGAHYDAQGNLDYIWTTPGDPSSQIHLTYDALGRVIQMADSKRGVVELYFYSPEGLRVRTEEYLAGALQKARFNIYNDQRQLVTTYEWIRE